MIISGVVVGAAGATATGLAVGAAGATSVAHFVERIQMKEKDKEIKAERNEERQMSAKEEANTPLEVGIKHFNHEHPLDEVDGSDIELYSCRGCGSYAKGRYLKCNDERCDFQLHKFCASPPVMLNNFQPLDDSSSSSHHVQSLKTFAHPPHLVKEVYKHADTYTCRHCNQKGDGIRYRCDSCEVDLHPICAKSPTRLLSFMHPEHELELMTRRHVADCAVCGHGSMFHNDRVYACEKCEFYVHPLCSIWPQYLFHELHPVLHPLQFLIESSQTRCKGCRKKCKHAVYYCRDCNEGFHPKCLLNFTRNGTTDGKMDKFRHEVVTHTAFHVGFTALHGVISLGSA